MKTIYLSEVEILRRFSVMEKKFPRCSGRYYFPSLNFYLNYYDEPKESLKQEADNMLAYVGLGMYTARVSISKLKGAVGKIELTDDMYAEITIDCNEYKEKDHVLATLAHELCHKILYRNGLFFEKFMEIENEIYADLATFYVGFGDLTMNDNRLKDESVAYLTWSTYAMAYNVFCIINGTINYEKSNLPDFAKKEVIKAYNNSYLAKAKLFTHNNISSLYVQTCSELSYLKQVYDIINSILEKNRKPLQERFTILNSVFYGFDSEKELEWHKMDIAYNYICYNNPNANTSEYKGIKQFEETLIYILDILAENGFVEITNGSDLMTKLECPICRKLINNNLESKRYHFICPSCKSHFVINNDFNSPLITLNQNRNKRKKEENDLLCLGKLREENDCYKKTLEAHRKEIEKFDRIKKKWWYKLFG